MPGLRWAAVTAWCLWRSGSHILGENTYPPDSTGSTARTACKTQVRGSAANSSAETKNNCTKKVTLVESKQNLQKYSDDKVLLKTKEHTDVAQSEDKSSIKVTWGL